MEMKIHKTKEKRVSWSNWLCKNQEAHYETSHTLANEKSGLSSRGLGSLTNLVLDILSLKITINHVFVTVFAIILCFGFLMTASLRHTLSCPVGERSLLCAINEAIIPHKRKESFERVEHSESLSEYNWVDLILHVK